MFANIFKIYLTNLQRCVKIKVIKDKQNKISIKGLQMSKIKSYARNNKKKIAAMVGVSLVGMIIFATTGTYVNHYIWIGKGIARVAKKVKK